MFITFEGIEGCGKSTQAKRIATRLERAGVSCILTREPGGTPIGNDIRQILLSSGNRHLPPLAELFLYEADRALHMESVVKPALAEKKWVLCDRFFDATTAYQGYARGQDLHMTTRLNEMASFGIKPDMTFLLDCPVSVGIKRALKRNAESQVAGQDRFEQEKTAFHEAVRHGYGELAKQNPDRFVVVDATQTEDRLEADIFSCLEKHLLIEP
ncbi:MAG: dTMP kinase [Deltaproteobacteria bacterium]|nr:dTMP kinase [Deltaproteobacteria bacterium]